MTFIEFVTEVSLNTNNQPDNGFGEEATVVERNYLIRLEITCPLLAREKNEA